MDNQTQTEARPIVVCLHGSASNGQQWRALRRELRGRCRLYTPDLIGYGSRRFRADKGITLQQEVDAILEQIGDITEPFHLIGHSYGGAVATYLALHYPERIRSLILYEPVNFALLYEDGLDTPAAQEVLNVRAKMSGNPMNAFARWRGAKLFIDYWSGERRWSGLPFRQRAAIAGVIPKVVAEYDAILAAQGDLVRVEHLEMPVRLICGTKTTAAAKHICRRMAQKVASARLVQLVGLKHLAPATHPDLVNPLLVDYVAPMAEASAQTARRRAG